LVKRGVVVALAVLASFAVVSLPADAAQPNASTPVNCTAPTGSARQCPNPPNQPGGLDIYLCYLVSSDQFSPPLVDLTDQFGVHDSVEPMSASSGHAWDNQLCNPASETVGGRFSSGSGLVYNVGNDAAHLFCYTDNTGASPMVTVSVQNQFGTGVFRVAHSTRLCLPSWKYDPNQSPSNPLASGSTNPSNWTDPSLLNLNHFQCYRVGRSSDGGWFNNHFRAVRLQDQFGSYTAFVGPAQELCAPVVKQVVNADGSAVGAPSTVNSDGLDGAHLLCFSVFAGGPHSVSVGNQFSATAASAVPNPVPVHVRFADQLCLPSFNTVIPPSDAPEVPNTLLLPLVGVVFGGGVVAILHRRRRRAAEV
jgi:hypothetical protein